MVYIREYISQLLARRVFPALAYSVCGLLSIGLVPSGQNIVLPFRGMDSQAATRPCDRCERTFAIGSSVKDRPITAYQFGESKHPIVYLGGMHGDEANSQKIMEQWRDELKKDPETLEGRNVVVIPAVNPDGIAGKSRLNTNGVDLNRNFPADDWKQDVTLPDQPRPVPAGGRSSLSEPESKALAAYLEKTKPRLVLSFHSKAAITEANEAGKSAAIAQEYAAKTGYRPIPRSQSDKIFTYDTTGAMEDWLRDKHNIPSVVVELSSPHDSEYERNKDALRYTLHQ